MSAKKIVQPTPAQIRATREAAGLDRHQAAELVHATYRTWQKWELDPSVENARTMPLATWELFLLKLEKLRAAARKR